MDFFSSLNLKIECSVYRVELSLGNLHETSERHLSWLCQLYLCSWNARCRSHSAQVSYCISQYDFDHLSKVNNITTGPLLCFHETTGNRKLVSRPRRGRADEFPRRVERKCGGIIDCFLLFLLFFRFGDFISSRRGPPQRTDHRLYCDNLSSRCSWQVRSTTFLSPDCVQLDGNCQPSSMLRILLTMDYGHTMIKIFQLFMRDEQRIYPSFTYNWTGLLTLDHSCLVGNFTTSKIAETKGLEPPRSWHFCISNFRTC